MKKKFEMICGCHVTDRIVFCSGHSKANEMAGTLNMIRGYYLKTMGADAEKSPFVQRIDQLLPRGGSNG